MLVVASSPPSPGTVRAAAAVLRRGELVVLPTDTVYGLAASPDTPGAVERIFAVKGRSRDVPIAVLCATPDQALSLAAAVSDEVVRIAGRLWPGPLTLVLRRRGDLGWRLGGREDTIGLRCPDHPLVRALASEVGPLATTSANRHGHPTPATAAEVARELGDGVALVLDGGPCTGVPSTVVDATGARWELRREGPVMLDDVMRAAEGREDRRPPPR